MSKKWMLLFIFAFCPSHVEAKSHKSNTKCAIEKLSSTQSQKFGGWIISIEKETQRKKPGDSLLGILPQSGKRCEIELESWGTGLFLAKSSGHWVIVEQQDTNYTSLSWIDLERCKTLKTLTEFGTVRFSDSGVSFSGGKDGPDSVASKEFPLDEACLPILK